MTASLGRSALKTAAAASVLLFAACSGGSSDGGGTAPPPTGSAPAPAPGGASPAPSPAPAPAPRSPSAIDTAAEAAQFLTNATFGPEDAEIAGLVGRDASAWVRGQFDRPASLVLPTLLARANAGEDVNIQTLARMHWQTIIGGDDQLRQRVAYALSQILVVNDDDNFNRPAVLAYYMDILSENAFGNYRDLLEAVTYSPAMGQFLTYLRNRKGNPDTGQVPDENYSREVMQLFTIGLLELNQDGTVRVDGAGNPLETYDNVDVTELAKVFTGLSYKGGRFWGDHAADRDHAPMQAFDEFHSEAAKSFLGTTIPAGTLTEESIDIALDTLVNHPNTAPFIGRQLIQRLVTSNPSPAYVERVARAFADGTYTMPDGQRVGDGRRGDLRATIAAVLLDTEALQDPATAPATFGKVREPVIRFVHWARAFDVDASDAIDERFLNDTSGLDRLAQQPYRSPSVFNFYRPGYVAPGSASAEAGLNAPELQIINESSSIGYVNLMSRYIRDDTPTFSGTADPSFAPNYDDEIALAEDPAALAAHLNQLLGQGRMSQATLDRIAATLAEIPISASDPDQAARDRRTRVEIAVMMTVTSPAFVIQR